MPERLMFRSLRGACNHYVKLVSGPDGMSREQELHVRAAFLAGARAMVEEAQRFLGHFGVQQEALWNELTEQCEGGDVHDTPQGHG